MSVRTMDFESIASANSATRPSLVNMQAITPNIKGGAGVFKDFPAGTPAAFVSTKLRIAATKAALR